MTEVPVTALLPTTADAAAGERESTAGGTGAGPAAAPWLPDELWTTIQDSVPIVCVDIVPVRRDEHGTVTDVGFIRRLSPFDRRMVWCHVGGRVQLTETLADALRRHLVETLGPAADVDLGADPQPDYVMQYLRDEGPRAGLQAGWDPRKQAVGLTYVVDVPAEVAAVAGGEGTEFRWFSTELLGALTDTWPGSLTAVRAALDADAARR